MITLTAKINLLSGDNSALSLGSDNLSGNNISSDLSGIVGFKKQGSNPFILGASKLGDGSTFSGKVGYYIGDRPSIKKEVDGVGIFENPYQMEISNKKTDLKSLTFSFDTVNNRHPFIIKISSYLDTGGVGTTSLTQSFFGGNTNPQTSTITVSGLPENSQITSIRVSLVRPITENPPNISTSNISGNSFDCTVVGGEEGNYTYHFTIGYSNKSTSLVREWEEFIDDDPIYTVIFTEQTNRIVVKIDNWNAPNFPIVITGIYAEVSIDIDRKNLISISRSIFDRSDLKLPSWGIISNTGNIEFNDTDGEIRDYAEQLLLQSGLKCEIKLNNTLVDGASETIGLFETDEWDYDNDNRVVSVSIKDDLEEWQDINIVGIEYDPRKIEHKPFSFFYQRLWAVTNDKYPMQNLEQLDEVTRGVLKNTYTQYPLLESGSLWEQWTKLCEVCQLRIYKDNNGVVVCRYNGGN